MKKILIATIFTINCFADLDTINQFEADFTQKIVDDTNKSIIYKGHIQAAKPQYALWQYTQPVEKEIYIRDSQVIVIEPELEQVIYKTIDRSFNFFSIINHAKKITKNTYSAIYKERKFVITLKNNNLTSISYHDDFDNLITINFSNIITNKIIPSEFFKAKIPVDFDIIKE